MNKYFLVLLLSFVNLLVLASHEGQPQNSVEHRRFSPAELERMADIALIVECDIEAEDVRFHGARGTKSFIDDKAEIIQRWNELLIAAGLPHKWNNEKSLTAAQ